MSFLSLPWRQGLSKASRNFARLFTDGDFRSDAFAEGLETVLIEADVGQEAAHELIEAVRSLPMPPGPSGASVLRRALMEKIRSLAGDGGPETSAFGEKPWVILVVGVNGTGKTTTIGKLAHRFRQEGRRILLAGADTFRAAAGEQLVVWGERAGASVITQRSGADPAAVAYDALDHAARHGADGLIVDTAGRLHTKVNLMEELKKIRRVLSKRIPSAPHETLLVLDATTGQNGLQQAKRFTEAAVVTGIVLTKLDGTAKGGVVLGIRRALKIPVRWVGTGEGIGDLVPFDPQAFAEGLLGEETERESAG